MSIIKLPHMTKKRGFLDTEEKVSNAQRSLEKATEADYKKYDEAKRAVNEFGKKLTEAIEKYCSRTLILSCLQVCKEVKEKELESLQFVRLMFTGKYKNYMQEKKELYKEMSQCFPATMGELNTKHILGKGK